MRVETKRTSATWVIVRSALLTLGAPALVSPPKAAASDEGLSPAGWACVAVARANGDLGTALTWQNADFDGGTSGDDEGYTGNQPVQPGEKIPVWCGFAGDDDISDNWGWMYGGLGDDCVGENWLVFKGGPGRDCAGPNEAYFAGGAGNDFATPNTSGRFDGGPGNDYVEVVNGGVFNGGRGDDYVPGRFGTVNSGTFNGGPGRDWVVTNLGTVSGGSGADFVGVNNGVFDGGPGWDTVRENHGTCVAVEQGC